MSFESDSLVDWAEFEAARADLGANFARILRYFEEDGTVAVNEIERAIRDRNSPALVTPAQTLRSDAAQFGAETLRELAERIEIAGRHFVEARQTPDELVPDVVNLRQIFDDTMAQLKDATNPLIKRHSPLMEKKVADRKLGFGSR